VHSILIILQSYPALFASFVPFFTSNLDAVKPAYLVVSPLKDQVNLTRRYLRTFKFFECFVLAWSKLTNPAGLAAPENFLDFMFGSLMGIFGMLETITIPDLAGIPGLEIFGPERTAALNLEAQRFWIFGLMCSVLSCGVKVIKLFAHAPVPTSGEGYGAAGAKEGEKEKEDWKAEQERLRKVVEERKKHRAEVRGKARLLMRKMLADTLDMIIPLASLEWYVAEPGVIGAVMLATTVLTGLDVWEKYGRQLAQEETK